MTVFEQILILFSELGPSLQVIEHAPEGRTGPASLLRKHPVQIAIKAMVVAVTTLNGDHRYFVAAVPGDRDVDFDAVAHLTKGTSCTLVERSTAELLTNCPMGGVPPLSFRPDLGVLIDRAILEQPEVVISAGRLDRSIRLPMAYYVAAAQGVIAAVSKRRRPTGSKSEKPDSREMQSRCTECR